MESILNAGRFAQDISYGHFNIFFRSKAKSYCYSLFLTIGISWPKYILGCSPPRRVEVCRLLIFLFFIRNFFSFVMLKRTKCSSSCDSIVSCVKLILVAKNAPNLFPFLDYIIIMTPFLSLILYWNGIKPLSLYSHSAAV